MLYSRKKEASISLSLSGDPPRGTEEIQYDFLRSGSRTGGGLKKATAMPSMKPGVGSTTKLSSSGGRPITFALRMKTLARSTQARASAKRDSRVEWRLVTSP